MRKPKTPKRRIAKTERVLEQVVEVGKPDGKLLARNFVLIFRLEIEKWISQLPSRKTRSKSRKKRKKRFS